MSFSMFAKEINEQSHNINMNHLFMYICTHKRVYLCLCIWHKPHLCSLWQRQAGLEPVSSPHALPPHPALLPRPS